MDPNIDPESFAIQQALARAAALRKGSGPARGQMVSGHYVRAPMAAHLLPLVNNLVADGMETKAIGQQQELSKRQQEALQTWLQGRPTTKTTYGAGEEGPTMETVEPTEQDTTAWATQGLSNPAARPLASKVIEDSVVQAPIRAEKARDKRDNTLLVNQRFEEDRKARAQLAAQQSSARLEQLRERLDRTDANSLAGRQLQRELATERLALQKYQIEAGIARADADRESREATAALRAGPKGTRGGSGNLSASQLKEIAELQDSAVRQQELEDGFKDNYSGPKAYVAAEVGGTFVNSNDPEAAEIAQWWRDFRANDNVERHALFGSALTASEKAAWLKTTVTPLSSKAQIRDAIATRKRISENAMKRRIELYSKGVQPEAAAPAPATNFPRTRVAPAEQKVRDNDAVGVLLQEWNDPVRAAARTEEDWASLGREIKRLKGTPPPRPSASAPPKTVKWSDLK